MATQKNTRQALHTLIDEWFANADAEFTIPIAPENIIGYMTTPSESSASPNWCILASVGSGGQPLVVGDSEEPGRFAILLFSRMDKGDNAETSREAAEDWLDDAEEMLIRNLLSSVNTTDWHEIRIAGHPRRDPDKRHWGSFRTSLIPIEIDKK